MTLATVGNKSDRIVTMSRDVKVQGDVAIEDCTGKSYDLVVCPGVSVCLVDYDLLRGVLVLDELRCCMVYLTMLYGAFYDVVARWL